VLLLEGETCSYQRTFTHEHRTALVETLRCEYVYDVQGKVSKGSTELGYRYLPRLSPGGSPIAYCLLVEQDFNRGEILLQVACFCYLTGKLRRINFHVVLRRRKALVSQIFF